MTVDKDGLSGNPAISNNQASQNTSLSNAFGGVVDALKEQENRERIANAASKAKDETIRVAGEVGTNSLNVVKNLVSGQKADFWLDLKKGMIMAAEKFDQNTSIGQNALETIFLKARTHNGWQKKDVPEALLRELHDTLKFGPTSANCCPARFIFVKSKEAIILFCRWM